MKKEKNSLSVAMEWLKSPRREPLPNDEVAWFLTCEIEGRKSRIREIEKTAPQSYTESAAMRSEVAALGAEINSLNAQLLALDSPVAEAPSKPNETDSETFQDESRDTNPAPSSKSSRKRAGWWEICTPYIVSVLQAGQYATGKELFSALEKKASPDSPFDKGTGSNRGSLFVREIGKPLAQKTIQNRFRELCNLARK